MRRRHSYLGDPPLGIAHRGGAGYAPNGGAENSVAAFRRSVELGYRYVETDVHVTADGVLVAFHDARLDRVTDATGALVELTFPEVRAVRIAGRERVPTFAEVLDALPGVRVNVDLKAPGTPELLWQVLRDRGALGRVCVGSFSNRRVWRFRRLARAGRRAGQPRVATASGRLGIAALRLLPWAVSRFIHTPGVAYQVPVDTVVLGRRVRIITPRFVELAHRLGKQVHAWTINHPAEMARLLDLGVDGIMTDRIDVLRDVLAARGQWR